MKNFKNENEFNENELEKNEKNKIIETDFEEFDFSVNDEIKYDSIYFVKANLKDNVGFELSQKINNITYRSKKIYKTLSGNLEKVLISEYTWEEKVIKTLKFYIVMQKEEENSPGVISRRGILFILTIKLSTTAGRNIVNSLLGCNKEIKTISISLYSNNGFTNAYVLINGKKALWKFPTNELDDKKEIIKDKKGNYVQTRYTELDEFLEDELRNHLSILLPNQITPKFVDDTESEDASKFFSSDPDLEIDENN